MKKILLFSLIITLLLSVGFATAQQAPVPPPAPTPDANVPAPANLTIARMEIAGAVENREPVGIAASFPATQDKVYCFLEFQKVTKSTTVTVVWTLGMNEMGKVPLTIKPYAKFRTWASKTIGGMKGDWKVDVLDEAGSVLKSAAFKVE